MSGSLKCESVADALYEVHRLLGPATIGAESADATPDAVGLQVAIMALYLMEAGRHLGRDIGILMSVVHNRILMGRDPFAPNWEEDVHDDFKPDEEPEVKPAPLDPRELIREVAGNEIYVDLSGAWAEIEKHGAEMEAHVKKKYGSGYHDWSGQNFLIAIAGEFAYGFWKGEEPNMELLKSGDGGSDFAGGVNVKATPATPKAPHLLLPKHEKIKGRFYVLVTVDIVGREARIWGWAPADEVSALPFREFGSKRILSRCIPADKLKPMRGY